VDLLFLNGAQPLRRGAAIMPFLFSTAEERVLLFSVIKGFGDIC
jgi:hypothetical protein